MDHDETETLATPEEIAADIRSSLQSDINELREALTDLTETPVVMSAIHALLYGDDALNAAVQLRRALHAHLTDWSAIELERRIDGRPSALERRLARAPNILQQRDALAAGAKVLLEQYDASGDFRMGGQLTNRPFLMLKDALAKVPS